MATNGVSRADPDNICPIPVVGQARASLDGTIQTLTITRMAGHLQSSSCWPLSLHVWRGQLHDWDLCDYGGMYLKAGEGV